MTAFETVDLEGVEILATGGPVHGQGSPPAGDQWTRTDLEALVDAHHALEGELRPPATIGHGSDAPAVGWLENVRINADGTKLLTDIRRVPRKVAELVKAGAYRTRSVELSRVRSQRNGRTYENVVTGLAWLGGKLPAVRTLGDVVKLYDDAAGVELRRVYVDDAARSAAPRRPRDPHARRDNTPGARHTGHLPSPATGSGMKWTTSWARAESNSSASNGSCSAIACRTSTPGWRSRAAATKSSEGSTAATASARSRPTSSGRQRTRTAADVEHPLAGRDACEVGETGSEQHRVPAHEPVVRVSRDGEGHRRNLAPTRRRPRTGSYDRRAHLPVDERHRIFISYSRRDFYFAEQLAVRLRRQGLEVWFDVHELGMGSDWAAAIDRGIAECDTFVLVASRAALESPWVQRERERAAELGRPCVAVLPERAARSAAPPGLPTYELTTSFRRGVGTLARDLAGGSPAGRRPRLRLPWPEGACFVALTLALAVLFAVVLGALFFRVALGQEARSAQDLELYVLTASGMLVLAGGLPAYTLWSFLRRRVTWLTLIGTPVNLLVIVPLSYVIVDMLAGWAGDPILRALGATSDDGYLGPAPIVLAGLVFVLCPAAVVVLVLSAGVCRFLRTGTAPKRVRARHIGGVPRPAAETTAVRSYRLLAAEEDAGVADELRRSLSDVGLREVAEGEPRDRDVVVLSDRTPAAWLERDDMREPVAVVATSVALPVRGRLMRFQWVDYRARRRKTLAGLARELAGDDSAAETSPTPLVPERLQQLRLPRPIVIAEWTLYAMGVLAAEIGVYALTDTVLKDTSATAWRSALFLVIAPVPVLLARRLRRRRITQMWLLGTVAAFWLALLAVGLDAFLQERFPTHDLGSYNAGTIGYPAIVAVVLALTWRSIRRWLPRRLRCDEQAAPTLGYARGSRLWLVMLIAALPTAAGTAALTTSTPAASLPVASPPPTASADMCRDRNALVTVLQPLYNAPKLPPQATQRDITAWFVNRSRIERDIIRELQKLEPAGSWGAEMRARLVAALDRLASADRGYARREVSGAGWQEAIRAFGVVNREVGTLRC